MVHLDNKGGLVMNYSDYRGVVNAVLDGDLEYYAGLEWIDNLNNVDVVFIVCHRINEGDLVDDIADDLASGNPWAWRDALQSVYQYDVDKEERM